MDASLSATSGLSEETSATFSSRFHAQLASLKASIPTVSHPSQLPPLRASLADLRLLTAAAAQWWVGYEMRRAQEELRAAADALDLLDRRLQPRKRFRFRGVAGVKSPAQSEPAQSATAKDAPLPNAEAASTRAEPSVTDCKCMQVNDAMVKACLGVVVFQRGSLCGKDVLIRDISGARVVILDVVGAVRANNLNNCEVVVGGVAGSVHVTGARDCKLRLACRQMRVHESFDCTFWLDVKGKPIVESCDRLRFGKSDIKYEGAGDVKSEAGLKGENRWREVQDFCWLHEGQSPHWSLVETGGIVAVDGDGNVEVID